MLILFIEPPAWIEKLSPTYLDTEIVDNDIDEDCDGFDLKTWYADVDGDTYGDIAVNQTANEQPTG